MPLFAGLFAEATYGEDHAPDGLRYDEVLALTVMPSGQPVVATREVAGETATVTKATGERDDADDDHVTHVDAEVDAWTFGGQTTKTGPKRESDDWASPWAASGKGMETATFVRSEGADWASDPELTTNTRVAGEADDWS